MEFRSLSRNSQEQSWFVCPRLRTDEAILQQRSVPAASVASNTGRVWSRTSIGLRPSFAVFFTARNIFHFHLAQLQTLMFVMLVFTGQGTVYLVRERKSFWKSRPSGLLIMSSVIDIVVVTLRAMNGVLMTGIPGWPITELFAATVVFLLILDTFKVQVFRRSASEEVRTVNFRRILIAVDESTFAANAANAGLDLARQLGAEVAFVTVVDPAVTQVASDSGVSADRWLAMVQQDAKGLLHAFKLRANATPRHWSSWKRVKRPLKSWKRREAGLLT